MGYSQYKYCVPKKSIYNTPLSHAEGEKSFELAL